MRKALREADIGVQEMADYLGVARTTVSTWINGRIEPSMQTLRLWALRCGVSFEWLADVGPGGRGTPKVQVGAGFRNKRTTTFRNTLAALQAVDHSRLTAVSQPFLRVRSGR